MRALLYMLLALVLPALAGAQPLQVNQTCAEVTGCFPGDDPGFPVTITQPGEYVLTSNLVNPERYTITTGPGEGVIVDFMGFEIIGSTDFARGISGGGTFRNGGIRNVSTGIQSGTAVVVEDFYVDALNSGIGTSGPSLTLRRSEVACSTGTVVACTSCLIEDSTIIAYERAAVWAVEATLIRVRASIDSQLLVTDAATIVESEIGVFEVGPDSSLVDSTVTCWVSPFLRNSASAGDFAFVERTQIGPGCEPTLGRGAHVKDSSFGELHAGEESTLRQNAVVLEPRGEGVGTLSVGRDSVVEANQVSVGGVPRVTLPPALSAGDGSHVRGNNVNNVVDGIACGEGCIVTGNTITNYAGTAITLGLTSIFCKNTIDGSGVAGIVGGITCDAAGVPSLTAKGAAVLMVGLMVAAVLLGGNRIRRTRNADGQA